MTAGVFAVDEVLGCTSVQFYDLTNTDDLLKASPLPIIFLSFRSFPRPTQLRLARCFVIGSLPRINIVPL